jgi:hypothetical protein
MPILNGKERLLKLLFITTKFLIMTIFQINFVTTARAFTGQQNIVIEDHRADGPSTRPGIFSWTPDGKDLHPVPQHCDARLIAKHFKGLRDAVWLQNFLKTCEYHWAHGSKKHLGALIQLANLNYDFQADPRIKEVTFTLADGTRRTGFLGLKEGSAPRPLVIAVCGLFCTRESQAGAIVFMQLFDELPYHVLLLGSGSSLDYARENGSVIFGGVVEGAQIYEIAHMMKVSQVFNGISDFLLYGQSLGGNGVLFASLFDTLNSQDKIFSGTFAICPLIDPGATIKNSDRLSFIHRGIWQAETRTALYGFYKHITALRHANFDSSSSLEQLMAVLTPLLFVSGKNNFESQVKHLRPFKSHTVNSIDELWSASNYFNWVNITTTPTFIINSDNDGLLDPSLNSLRLHAILGDSNPDFKVLRLKYGSHCGSPLSSSWAAHSLMIQSYYESLLGKKYDGRHTFKLESIARNQQDVKNLKLKPREKVAKKYWHVDQSGESIQAVVLVLNESQDQCVRQASHEESHCYRRIAIEISPDKLSLPVELKNDRTPLRGNRLSRWLNTRSEIFQTDAL